MASRQVLFVSALMAVVCRLQGQQDVSAGVSTLIGMVQNLQVQVNTLQNAMSGGTGACPSSLPRGMYSTYHEGRGVCVCVCTAEV